MIRSAAQKALLLAVAALFTSAAVTSCNKSKSSVTDNVGSVDLALSLSPGVNVSSVSYEITGAGLPSPITGSINVADPGATISLLISGIPAGMGYTITLSATSTDGGTTCLGSSMFNITAGATTAVTVAMQCRGPAPPPAPCRSTARPTTARPSARSRSLRPRPAWAAPSPSCRRRRIWTRAPR